MRSTHYPDSHRYDDLLQLPHPTSPRHRPMARPERAAQFSPFAALVGLDATLAETSQAAIAQVELEGRAKALLDHEITLMQVKGRAE